MSLGSSRSSKHELEPIDPADALAAVLDLPLYRWKYRDDRLQALHVGPMAEDFYARFALGRDDRHLSPADSAGVALAAIQGLNERLEARMSDLLEGYSRLQKENDELMERVESNARLHERLEDLEQALAALTAASSQER